MLFDSRRMVLRARLRCEMRSNKADAGGGDARVRRRVRETVSQEMCRIIPLARVDRETLKRRSRE